MIKILPKRFEEEKDSFSNLENDIRYQSEMVKRGLLDPQRYFRLKKPEFIGQNFDFLDQVFKQDSQNLIEMIEKATLGFDRIAPKVNSTKNIVLSFKQAPRTKSWLEMNVKILKGSHSWKISQVKSNSWKKIQLTKKKSPNIYSSFNQRMQSP